MTNETKKTASETSAASGEVVVVSDVHIAEKPTESTTEKEVPPSQPEPEVPEKQAPSAVEEVPAKAEKVEEKITESVSFKEESNVVGELPDRQKKALDELKQLVQEALNKHEFTVPPPQPVKEEEKAVEKAPEDKTTTAPPAEEEKPEVPSQAPATADAPPPEAEELKRLETEAEAPPAETKKKEKTTPPTPPAAETKEVESTPPPAAPVADTSEPKKVAEVVEKIESVVVDEDGAKMVEAIKETIVEVAAHAPASQEGQPAKTEEASPAETKEVAETTEGPPPMPEEVSIWGIPLLADERSDVILLKFLRARDFKVKDAFAMLKNVVAWRKEFGIESLLEEDLDISDLEKAFYMHGVDEEGHPVCYNVFGRFRDKELYQNSFADEEKRTKFLRWRIQFLEKSIRNLDFSPDGINTIVQINDLKNSPGPFKKELRQSTNLALQLLQDNYPEFVAKQLFINVPWWYLAFYRMINPFFTQRTKSKFVFAGVSKSAEALLKYIAAEKLPVQYGGLSREGEKEFTAADPATEEIIKQTTKHTVEIPVSEACTLVWEARVIGWDVSYGAEFVPSAEGGYTVIVQKSRKITPADETVISSNFKIGEAGKVVLTFDNQTSKKKKLLYRIKTKPSD